MLRCAMVCDATLRYAIEVGWGDRMRAEELALEEQAIEQARTAWHGIA